ncbi:hypothetical protein GCM10029963_16630 [Micromonospora andamanensis]
MLAGGLVAGSLVAGAAGLSAVTASAADRDPAAPNPGQPAAMFQHDVPGVDEAPNRPGADRQRPEWRHDPGASPKRPAGGADRPAGHHGRAPDGKVVPVPCDSARLIAALVWANAEGGATLRLAEKCTYTLTHAFQQPDEYDGGIRDAREAADAAENPGDAEAPPRNPADDKAGLPVIYHGITIEGSGATIVRGSTRLTSASSPSATVAN